MKIAVTTAEPSLDAAVDPRFAQAPYVLIVDLDSMEYAAYENPATKPAAAHHGMVAARFVALQDADAVISGSYCPHSFAALRAIGVTLYAANGEGTAGEMVGQLQRSALPAAAPSADHHHAHAAHLAHQALAGDTAGAAPNGASNGTANGKPSTRVSIPLRTV